MSPDGLAATAVFRNWKRSSVTMKLSTEFLVRRVQEIGCRGQVGW